MQADNRKAQLLLLEMALREAKRRTKKAKPPASAVVEVLNELGFKLVAS